MSITHFLHKIGFALLEFLALLIDDLHLSIEYEFLPLDLQSMLGKILETAIEVALHLRVLGLQETDMLMTCLVIVIEGPDARFLLILNDLFAQDFKLELHKVNLLLQIYNIVVGGVHVGIVAKLAYSRLLLLLASKVHSDS